MTGLLGLELRAMEVALPSGLADLRSDIADTVRGLQEVVEEVQGDLPGDPSGILSRGSLEPALTALARRSVVPVELTVWAFHRGGTRRGARGRQLGGRRHDA